MISRDADPSSPQAYGDTKTQTVGVLNKIKQILEGQGLGMADVVKMQVFLVHDARAPMDFKAFMEGYTQFFGGTQPNLPARSVVGIAALANPGFLVRSKSSPPRTRSNVRSILKDGSDASNFRFRFQGVASSCFALRGNTNVGGHMDAARG